MYAQPDYTLAVNRPEFTPQEMIDGDNEHAVKNIQEILKKDIAQYVGDKGTPLIIGGDFNSCSHLVWTEETAKSRLHYDMTVDFPVSRIMANNDFKDSYREFRPDPVKYIRETCSPLYNYCQDFRIDFIYYRGQNIHIRDFRVIDRHPDKSQMFPSDHAAVLSIFEIDDILNR